MNTHTHTHTHVRSVRIFMIHAPVYGTSSTTFEQLVLTCRSSLHLISSSSDMRFSCFLKYLRFAAWRLNHVYEKDLTCGRRASMNGWNSSIPSHVLESHTCESGRKDPEAEEQPVARQVPGFIIMTGSKEDAASTDMSLLRRSLYNFLFLPDYLNRAEELHASIHTRTHTF